jgi:hypothetical protein
MAQFTPPDKFTFVPDQWLAWLSEFEGFRISAKLDADSEERQIHQLKYCMGTHTADQIFQTFKYGRKTVTNRDGVAVERAESAKCYEDVVKKFTDYFVVKVNKRHERFKFQARKQLSYVESTKLPETAEEFVRELQKLIRTCEYADEEDQLLDRFVLGLRDASLSKKLQLKHDLTMDEAFRIVRQSEQMARQQAEQDQLSHTDSSPTVSEVRSRSSFRGRGTYQGYNNRGYHSRGNHNRGNHSRGRGQPPFRPGSSQAQYDNYEDCENCGLNHAERQCPARGKACKYCRKMGHIISMCRKKGRKDVQEVREEAESTFEEYEDDHYWLYAVHDEVQKSAPWEVSLNILSNHVKFKIDTGADISLMDVAVYHNMKNKPVLSPSSAKLMSPGGTVKTVGEFVANVTHKGKNYNFTVVVAHSSSTLLGRSEAAKMGIVVRVDAAEQIFGSKGTMNTEPVKIHMKDNAEPYCVNSARRVPFPIFQKVKAELERLHSDGVIRPVHEPSEWCAPIVPVIKKNGNVRITVDYKRLNQSVKRQQYMLPNLEDIAPKLTGATVFSSLDAASGYYQIPLEESSSMLTTFITPFGRYCFNRLPMGVSCAPEIFQKKMSELLAGHEGCEVIMDDILVYGKDEKEHDLRLEKVFTTIRNSGLKLSKEKCNIKKNQLIYFGHLIGSDGIKPNPAKIEAIQNMPAPKNVSELRTLVGMINYLGRFIQNLSTTMKPMLELLQAEKSWNWGQPQDEAFDSIKKMISTSPCLSFYQSTKKTIVSADASSYGIGGALFQMDGSRFVPIAFCSRTLTESERKYAQIEKECLASVWTCEKFEKYLVGLSEFELYTDHKPLVPLMTTKDLDQCPVRCQRLLMRLMRFNPKVCHIPGKELVIADALSRNPLPHDKNEEKRTEEITEFVDSIRASWPTTTSSLLRLQNATAQDPVLQTVATYISEGWPKTVSLVMQPYQQRQGELCVVDGLVVCGSRIVIPQALREETLQKLHETHQGQVKCQERASAAIWWPGLSKEIEAMVNACQHCIAHRPAQRKEPLRSTPLPRRPWEKIGTDLCEKNKQMFLITTDYYSRWIDIRKLGSTTSSRIIEKLKGLFCEHGIPDEIQTDNGPQFRSVEFEEFAAEYGFHHHTTSPHMHQANGAVERAVQTAKKILDSKDPPLALLNYRATPNSTTGVSPAEALMGRQLKTKLPVLPANLLPKPVDQEKVRETDAQKKEKQKFYYDRRHGVRNLWPLKPGQSVLVKTDEEKTWKNEGKIILADPENRTYMLQTPTGLIRRNRLHIQPTTKETPEVQPPNVEPETPKKIKETNVDQSTPIAIRKGARSIRKPARFRLDP